MTRTEKYGKPQGNEFVYGKDIIRRTDTFEFSVIDRLLQFYNKIWQLQVAYDITQQDNKTLRNLSK